MKIKFRYDILKTAFAYGLIIGLISYLIYSCVDPKYVFDNGEIPKMYQGPDGSKMAIGTILGFIIFFAPCTWDYLQFSHSAKRLKFINNFASALGAAIPMLVALMIA